MIEEIFKYSIKLLKFIIPVIAQMITYLYIYIPNICIVTSQANLKLS